MRTIYRKYFPFAEISDIDQRTNIQTVLIDMKNLFRILVASALICSSLLMPMGGERAAAANGSMQVGTNIDSIVDYSSSWFFIDAFKMSREWLTRTVGSSEWDSSFQDEILTDANGWPTQVPARVSNGTQQYVHTLLPTQVNGPHTLIVYGTGELEISGQRFSATGGRNEFTYDVSDADPTSHSYLLFELHESDPSDPVQAAKFLFPGFTEAQSDTDIFHPLFLEGLQSFSVLRFMDAARTNNQTSSSWADRTPLTSYTQAREYGASLEVLIALANKVQKDPWFCIPHRADDGYVREMARLLRDTVDQGLKIYIEYSNEVWNGMFDQHDYATEQGSLLGYDRPWHHHYANRIGRIWEIFEEEFDDDSRFVRLIAGQSANAWQERQILGGLRDPSINASGILAEAVAIAPYFGRNYRPGDAVPSLDEIFNVIVPEAIAENVDEINGRQQMLEDNNLRLIAYEGGQHFVGIHGAENNDQLTAVLQDANRDPRMYDAYTDYLEALEGPRLMDLFAHFTYTSRWTKWGSWGALEYQNQPLTDAPKHRALLDFIGTVVGAGLSPTSATITANPTSVAAGDNATLTWTSSNADSCIASGDWSGTKGTAGTEIVSPASDATYTLTCTGPGGSASDSASVSVMQSGQTPPPNPLPTPSTDDFDVGARVVLIAPVNLRDTSLRGNGTYQDTGAMGVIVGGPQSGGGGTEFWDVDFDSGADGWVRDAQLSIISATPTPTQAPAPAPTATITANPTSLIAGNSTTLTWSSTNADSCTASGDWGGTKATDGTESVSPTSDATYTIDCIGAGGSAVDSASVSVTQPTPTPSPTGFEVGANVVVTSPANLRGANLRGIGAVQDAGATGTIVGGPQSGGGNTQFWDIDFDSGADGWVRDTQLSLNAIN